MARPQPGTRDGYSGYDFEHPCDHRFHYALHCQKTYKYKIWMG